MRSTLVSVLKREFQGQSRLLTHNRPEQFAKSQWHGRGSTSCIWLFLVYRWLLAIFLLASLIISIADIRFLGKPEAALRRAKWPIYLTNWAFLGLTVQALLAAALATKHHLALGKPDMSMTKVHKCYWVLNNLSGVLAPAITIGYWGTVYNPQIHPIDFVNITVHVMNTVIVIVDLFISGHPVRLLHAYQSILLAIVYTVFTGIYFLAGGTNRDGQSHIYPLLNWNKPHWTLLAGLGAAILLVILHVLMWSLFLLRRKIAVTLLGKEYRSQVTTQLDGEVAITSGVV